MIIRPADLADAELLARYVIDEAREAEDRALERDRALAATRTALADPALARYWIAEGAGAPIGAIMVTREWSDWNNGAYWYIQFVFVEPAGRGQGVLRALVEHVRGEMQREGGVELRLYVHPENARAVRAYEKLGFARLPYVMMALRD